MIARTGESVRFSPCALAAASGHKAGHLQLLALCLHFGLVVIEVLLGVAFFVHHKVVVSSSRIVPA